MFIHKLCDALKEAKIPYAVVGGYAVAFHGAVRGTVDVDVVINWTLKTLEKTEQVFEDLGLVSKLPIHAKEVFHFRDEYIKNRNLIAWNFYNPSNPLEQVDLIISYDLREAQTKIHKTHAGDIKILSLKDLIEMKKESGRPQDLLDIQVLEDL